MNWDEDIPDFQRFEKINREFKTKGEKRTVKVVEEPKRIPSETVESAYSKKNITDIQPKDCFVMLVEDKGQKKEFWFNETSYSVRSDLKAVKDANEGSLAGAEICIKRVAVNDPTKPNWKIEMA